MAPPGSGYLDAASTEPLHPAARDVLMTAVDEGWGDPARLYGAGRRARLLLDNAREVVAAVLGCRLDEVSFTGSGTQAVHLGVLGTLAGRRRAGRGMVVSAVEHSAVLQAGAHHESAGGSLVVVPVDGYGRVDPEAYADACARTAAERSAATGSGTTGGTRSTVALACLQAANHEVGTVQPVEEVAEICAAHDVPLLVDAAQVMGQAEIPAGWAVLTASAHKWGGPPGVGVLAVRRRTRWRAPGPEDERGGGRVPGFENVPGALAAAAALRARVDEAAALATRHRALVERIRARVPEIVPDVEVVGDPVHRLPHLVTFSCLYVDGEALVTELNREGFAVSSGSSCTASTLRPSHVLEAMGVLTHGNVRVSLSRQTTEDDVERFLSVLPGVVQRLRAMSGAEGL